jgi:amino-acid N-acetyltransferase
MDVVITAARAADVDAIKQLLEVNELPLEGVDDHWKTFVVARDGETLIGCGGSEAYSNAALIRSIAVDPTHRNRGIARMIVRQLLDRLSAIGVREFYLLTTTAQDYFKKRGFKKCDRDEVNPQLLASREFQDACPSTATVMRLVMQR